MSGHPIELTDEQISAIRDMFLLFDQDGNETITINELGIAMRALGQHPTEEELKAIIAEIDADGNGIIEFDEFVDLMSRRPWGLLGSHDELTDAFSIFDHDGSGYINAAEFRHVMTTMGEKLTDEQLNEMVKEFEADGEGKVQFKNYVDCILD
ncbi:hypothetical protein CAPTEDRAFT_157499 [Capitella teleta]|uniref:EF-hand domain-containing protein n=1 Tax=Capitella teleta TaxID=283909 RepID=R7UPV2_CAPTE|nr:hypothetical protein CAPTEDRAFT_157499 [Capitella teleta]|eukprot:ELU05456.1 hypothetical protein CAPTEDRAFT_157499 [Capitella teleta]